MTDQAKPEITAEEKAAREQLAAAFAATAKATNKPVFEIFSVQGQGKGAQWTRIGAAWAHEDGEGMNLRLDALPQAGARVVLRAPKQRKAETAEGPG